MTGAVQLSCEQCKRRKIRCDRSAPCASCKASHLACTPVKRTRLPRGRTKSGTGRNGNLRDKVARLEKLVIGLETQINDGEPHSLVSDSSHLLRDKIRLPTDKLENSVAREFWMALSSEISGIRELLEESDQDDEDDEDQPGLAGLQLNDRAPMVDPMFASFLQCQPIMPLPKPSQDLQKLFVHLYRTRVDWLLKFLHWPTASSMLAGQSTKADSEASRADLALKYAVYFLAICTLLDYEFQEHLLGDRAILIEQYQRATETLLSQAGLLTTTNTTLLQAFVLYIAAIRCSVSAAAAWTLVATAVRIAHACNLNAENLTIYSHSEMEIRRRLWFSIGFLDSQTSFGRGTSPLIPYQDLSHPPQNINDADVSVDQVVPRAVDSFTDMSFANLCHQAMICQRKLIDPDFGSWRVRLDTVAAFEHSVAQCSARFESSSDAKHVYTAYTARSMPVTMQLLLRRPLYKNFKDDVPPSDGRSVLDIGCNVLQTGLTKAQFGMFAEFSWFKWPKWFALAVVLVELCSLGPSTTFDQAFAIAQRSYNDYAQSAADLCSGQLWKPIAKLMWRVQKLQEARSVMGGHSDPITAEMATGLAPRADKLMSPFADDLGGTHSTDFGNNYPFSTSNSLPVTDATFAESDNEDTWIHWDTFLNDFNDQNPSASENFFA